jgi:hypothetical protein
VSNAGKPKASSEAASEQVAFSFAALLLVRFFAPLKTGYKHPEGHKGKQRKRTYNKI